MLCMSRTGLEMHCDKAVRSQDCILTETLGVILLERGLMF